MQYYHHVILTSSSGKWKLMTGDNDVATDCEKNVSYPLDIRGIDFSIVQVGLRKMIQSNTPPSKPLLSGLSKKRRYWEGWRLTEGGFWGSTV